MAIPSRSLLTKIIYNSGRVFIYALIGYLLGLLGSRLILAGFQQTISIIAGVLIIIVVLVPRLNSKFLSMVSFYSLLNLIKNPFVKLLNKHSYPANFAIGALNGLLPCGLLYIAFLGSASMGNEVNSSLFMAIFGLGTLPSLLTISLLANPFKRKLNFKKLVPVLSIVLAMLFILRGLNLGIPYLSPKINLQKNAAQTEIICH